MYHNDFETEPIGGSNPYYRCFHCKRSVPEINGRIDGHEKGCLYRLIKECGADYDKVFRFIYLGAPEEEGPTAEDGPDEEGFRGPRPWNGFAGSDPFALSRFPAAYDDSEEKRETAEGESRGTGVKLFDVNPSDDSLRLFDVGSTDDSLKLFGDD